MSTSIFGKSNWSFQKALKLECSCEREHILMAFVYPFLFCKQLYYAQDGDGINVMCKM